jgi:hypothetical protein
MFSPQPVFHRPADPSSQKTGNRIGLSTELKMDGEPNKTASGISEMPASSNFRNAPLHLGISNRRLLKLDQAANTICFDHKDYADGARHKQMTLALEEFIRRLRLHFLPPKFVKIRHYGLLANRGRRQRLQQARALLKLTTTEDAAASAKPPATRSLPRCPHCGWTALFLVRVLAPSRLKTPPPAIDSS